MLLWGIPDFFIDKLNCRAILPAKSNRRESFGMEKNKNQTPLKHDSKIKNLYLASIIRNNSGKVLISDYAYSGRTDLWHCHCDFYELVVVTGGAACSERVDGSEWLQVGSLCLFQPGTVHRYCAMRDFRHFNLLFSPDLLKGEQWDFTGDPAAQKMFFSPDKVSQVYYLKENDFAAISDMLQNLLIEYRSRRNGYQNAVFFRFGSILTFLLRHIQTEESRVRSVALMVERAIHFMEENLVRPLKLLELARNANMSVSSFRHKFMEVTGISPVEYLIRLRLKRAIRLLAGKEQLSEIARQSGFADTNYFCRQFKKHLQISPRNFQSRIKSGEVNWKKAANSLLYHPVSCGNGIHLQDNFPAKEVANSESDKS